jgi:hypothetical protein
MRHDVDKVQFFDVVIDKIRVVAKGWVWLGRNKVKIQIRKKNDGGYHIKWPYNSYKDRKGEWVEDTLFTIVEELRDTLRPARDQAIIRAFSAWVEHGRKNKQIVNVRKQAQTEVKETNIEASQMTVRQLKVFLRDAGVKLPAGADKKELAELAQSI